MFKWANLSRGDKVALRRASERKLLLRDHHHLGAGGVDRQGPGGPGATTRLHPGSTGGHRGSVLIVSLKANTLKEKKQKWFMEKRECYGSAPLPLKSSWRNYFMTSERVRFHSDSKLAWSRSHTELHFSVTEKTAVKAFSPDKLREEGRREKAVTCSALYPPFSRTTHEQRAREAWD